MRQVSAAAITVAIATMLAPFGKEPAHAQEQSKAESSFATQPGRLLSQAEFQRIQAEAVRLRDERNWDEAVVAWELVYRHLLAKSGAADRETIRAYIYYGSAYAEVTSYAESQRVFAEAYEVAKRSLPEKDDVRVLATASYSSVLRLQRKWALFEPIAAQYVRLLELSPQRNDRLIVVGTYNYARGILELGRPNDAKPILERAYAGAIATFGPETNEALTVRQTLARTQKDLGEYEEALAGFREVYETELRSSGATHRNTLISLNSIGQVLGDLGRYTEAEEVMARSLELRRTAYGVDHREVVVALIGYAGAVSDLGRIDEAIGFARQAYEMSLRVNGPDDNWTTNALGNYGSYLRAAGRTREARTAYQEALIALQRTKGEFHPSTLTVMGNLAGLSDGEEGLLLREKVLEAQRRVLGDSHPSTITTLQNFALELREIERVEEAEALMREALALSIETLGADHPSTILTKANYAGFLPKSEGLTILAEVVAQQRDLFGPDDRRTIVSESNFAAALVEDGQLSKAADLLGVLEQRSLSAFGQDHSRTLTIQNNLGYALLQLGRNREANSINQRVFETRKRALDRSDSDLINSAFQLSESRLRLPEIAATALEPARFAMEGFEQRQQISARAVLRSNALVTDRQQLRRVAQWFFIDAAWARAQEAASETDALRNEVFAAMQKSTAGSASRAVARQAGLGYASEAGLSGLVEEREELSERWDLLDQERIEAQANGSAGSQRRDQLRTLLASISTRVSEIDDTLKSDAPLYFNIVRQPELSVQEAGALLAEDEAVLMIVPTMYHTHVMAVTKEGLAWHRADLDYDDIAVDVRRLRNGLSVDQSGFLGRYDLARAHQLFAKLIAPVEEALNGKSRLYTVSMGPLTTIPWGVLVTKAPAEDLDYDDPEVLRSTGWLADKFALVQLPSLQSLSFLRSTAKSTAPTKSSSAKLNYAGFGDPVLSGTATVRGIRSASLAPVSAEDLFRQSGPLQTRALVDPALLRNLARLPGTRIEVEEVGRSLAFGRSDLFVGEQMTEAAIRSADLSSVGILHLATHGITSSESGSLAEPGLIFTPPAQGSLNDDGYLSASEVAELDLASALWVILSACNTAASSGEGVPEGLSGLARSFFLAGAPSLLVSHWPVYDDVAARLSAETIRYQREGLARAEALQRATREIRLDPKMEAYHPAVWAPFTLVGEGM